MTAFCQEYWEDGSYLRSPVFSERIYMEYWDEDDTGRI